MHAQSDFGLVHSEKSDTPTSVDERPDSVYGAEPWATVRAESKFSQINKP